MLKQSMGPRSDAPTRQANPNAAAASQRALAEKEGRETVWLPKEQIVSDNKQPRRRKRADAVKSKRQSIEQEGQAQPIKVRPIGLNRYQLIDGELRWLGTPPGELIESIVEERPLDDEQIFAQQIAHNEHEGFSQADYCYSCYRLKNEFGRGYDYIAENHFPKESGKVARWAADRAQLWGRIPKDEKGEPTGELGQGLETLLADYEQGYTAALYIASLEKKYQLRALRMALDLATVAAIKKRIAEWKDAEAPTPPTKPQSSTSVEPTRLQEQSSNGISVSRSGGSSSGRRSPEQLQADNKKAVELFAGSFQGPRDYTVVTLQTKLEETSKGLSTANASAHHAEGQLDTVIARSDWTPTAREALRLQVNRELEAASSLVAILAGISRRLSD